LSLTVLLDLDDTLLLNDMSAFQKVYLPLLSKTISELPLDAVINQVLAATSKMIDKNSPGLTLENIFDQHFFPAIGVSKKALFDRVNFFYSNVFPTLKYLTTPNPNAVSLIEYLFAGGHDVVIATSPLFPRTATIQRLEWANLPIQKYNFRLVSTYETFHFAKPNPSYFAEILSQLGWPEARFVMIGNSLLEDIIPAERLGLPTFWLNGKDHPEGSRNPYSRSGSFEEIIPWINKISVELPKQFFNSPAALIAILNSTPAALDTLCKLSSRKRGIINRGISSLCKTDIDIHLPVLNQLPSSKNNINHHSLPFTDHFPLKLNDFFQVRTELVHTLEKISPGKWGEISVANRASNYPVKPVKLVEFINSIAKNDMAIIQNIHQSISQT